MKTADAIATYPSPLTLPDERESTASSNNVLLIDDEPIIRTLLEKILTGNGYNTTTANDGEEGWSALCSKSFDLVITDHDMPRLTGVDLIRRLRSASNSLPVILISGQMPWEETDLLTLLQPGVAIEKPFSGAEILDHVRNLLTQARAAASACSQRSFMPKGPMMMVATW